MKKNQNWKKLSAMSDVELKKEISTMQSGILNLRIDIANRKTKGIHRISQLRADIARSKTILSARIGEKNND